MSSRNRRILFAIPLLLATAGAGVRAQSSDRAELPTPSQRFIDRWETAGEIYLPTSDDREITTVNLNASLGATLSETFHLAAYGGLTATYAWGEITQLNDRLEDTTLENAAAGIGPFVGIRWTPFIMGDIAIAIDASEGIILYSERFPAGGDIYNGMFRVGLDVTIPYGPSGSVAFGYRWMHVSNGQGLGPFNPSYEGAAAKVTITSLF